LIFQNICVSKSWKKKQSEYFLEKFNLCLVNLTKPKSNLTLTIFKHLIVFYMVFYMLRYFKMCA
jgi:hypothetical protein